MEPHQTVQTKRTGVLLSLAYFRSQAENVGMVGREATGAHLAAACLPWASGLKSAHQGRQFEHRSASDFAYRCRCQPTTWLRPARVTRDMLQNRAFYRWMIPNIRCNE
jgi:hypothetical protein